MDERLTQIEACLQTLPLFQSLSQQERAALAARTRVEERGPEDLLFHQGDPGDSYYVVDEGEVEITVTLPAGMDENDNPKFHKIRKILTKGEAFGEMSLLTGANRAGDAKTLAPTRLLVIDKAAFRELLLANQTIAAELGATMLRILESNQTSKVQENNSTIEFDRDVDDNDENGPPSVIIEVQEDEESLLKKIKGFFGLS